MAFIRKPDIPPGRPSVKAFIPGYLKETQQVEQLSQKLDVHLVFGLGSLTAAAALALRARKTENRPSATHPLMQAVLIDVAIAGFGFLAGRSVASASETVETRRFHQSVLEDISRFSQEHEKLMLSGPSDSE